MKRKISAALAFTMALPTVLTTVSGCVKASADNVMSNGELVEMVISTFGFEGYQSAEPYISNVKQGNEYFDAVQTAVEFGVIDESVTELDVNAPATREFCAMLLSGAIFDDKTDDVAINDMAEIKYLDDVKTVLNYGIMELDEKSNFNPDETLEIFESSVFTDAAYQVWCTCTGDEPEYEVTLKDNVVDLSGISFYSYDESKESMTFDSDSYKEVCSIVAENGFSHNSNDGTINVNSAAAIGAEVGTIIITPDNGAVKVTEIKKNPDGTEKLITQPADIEEVIENYSVEQSISPDFTQATFYDADGNIVSGSEEAVSNMSANIAYLSASEDVQQLGSGTLNRTFDTEVGKVAVSVGKGTIKASLVTSLASIDSKDTEPKGSPFKYSGELELNYGYEFNNITFDYDAEFGFWEKKHCKFVMNYQTVEKIGLKGNYSQTVKVCSMDCPTGIGDLTVSVGISLGLTIDGEIEVAITTNGRSNGFEWRELKNFSVIKNGGRQQVDVTGHAKIEARLPITLSISVLFGVVKGGIVITPGAGAQLDIETTQIEESADANPVPLICAQIEVYPIFELSAYATLDIKILNHTFKSDTFKILGSNNVVASMHMESYGGSFPEVVQKCTKDERLKALSDAEMQAAGVSIGDKIILKESVIEVEVDETFEVALDTIPSGYTFEDFKIVSFDKEHIKLGEGAKSIPFFGTFDKFTGISYTATAIAEGRTTLVVMTNDNKYSANCTVKITDPNAGTDYSIKLETYAVDVPAGTTSTIKIEGLPAVITENDVLWSSDDTAVVVVDQYGKFTARAPGSAIITAATPDKKSIAACSIFVTTDPRGNLTVNVIPVWVAVEKEI